LFAFAGFLEGALDQRAAVAAASEGPRRLRLIADVLGKNPALTIDPKSALHRVSDNTPKALPNRSRLADIDRGCPITRHRDGARHRTSRPDRRRSGRH
jgi:hypothetical protein